MDIRKNLASIRVDSCGGTFLVSRQGITTSQQPSMLNVTNLGLNVLMAARYVRLRLLRSGSNFDLRQSQWLLSMYMEVHGALPLSNDTLG